MTNKIIQDFRDTDILTVDRNKLVDNQYCSQQKTNVSLHRSMVEGILLNAGK